MASQTLPSKIMRLNRDIVINVAGATASVVKAAVDSVGRVLGVSRTAGKTVTGQTRSVVERTATTAQHGAREVFGQADAQGSMVASTVTEEAHRVVDDATAAVEDRPTRRPYEEWTRAQLYDRAQELEVEGRGSMTKAELIEALRRH
jgi:diadenosine tetraphosphatase ApaH/serine/threonine PP2A family protein phosphatase